MKTTDAPALPHDFEDHLADIQSEVSHLGHLLDVTVRELEGAPFIRDDGTRIAEMFCVHSLLWIAREMSEKLRIDMEAAAQARAHARSAAR
jgi:hypothetical protein